MDLIDSNNYFFDFVEKSHNYDVATLNLYK